MSSRPSRGAARLAAILDALPDALVLVNANGTVVNANTIALEAFETPGTALVGRGLLDLLPEFDSRLIPGSMRRPEHDGPARAHQADPDDRAAHRRHASSRSRSPARIWRTASRPTTSYGYTGDELLMLVVRDLSGHRRHRGRAGAFAAADRDDPAGRVRGRRRDGHRRAGRARQPGRRADPRVTGPATSAASELHTLILHSRADGDAVPVRGVAARRHPALRAQAPGARAGAVVEERRQGPGRPDDRAGARRRPARRRRA